MLYFSLLLGDITEIPIWLFAGFWFVCYYGFMENGGGDFEQEFAQRVRQEVVARQEREEEQVARGERKKIVAVILLAAVILMFIFGAIILSLMSEVVEPTIVGRWNCGEVVYDFDEEGNFALYGDGFGTMGLYRFGGEAAKTVVFDEYDSSELGYEDYRYVAPAVVRFVEGGGFELAGIGEDWALSCARAE